MSDLLCRWNVEVLKLLCGLICGALLAVAWNADGATAFSQNATTGWKTFANRAGWKISYPSSWRVQSCTQCKDPTDPDVFVSFSSPSTKLMIMIEHLIDKPSDQTVEQWLNDVKKTTVLAPEVSEQWTSLGWRRSPQSD
jgi:hypothetical protein